jgi:hypothetical protein
MNQKNDEPDKNIAADQRPRPSQAEGEEEPGQPLGNRPLPSQAEGDRETVNQDLARK